MRSRSGQGDCGVVYGGIFGIRYTYFGIGCGACLLYSSQCFYFLVVRLMMLDPRYMVLGQGLWFSVLRFVVLVTWYVMLVSKVCRIRTRRHAQIITSCAWGQWPTISSRSTHGRRMLHITLSMRSQWLG